jgi:AraC-like DNA-binding protein
MDLAQLDWQLDLCSPFWRIYVNDRSGAYIEHEGKRLPLAAKQVWIVPAWVRFQTGYRGRIVQDYLHFTFGGFSPVLMRRFNRPIHLKTAAPIQGLVDQWRHGIADRDSFSHLCSAGALAHACMALLLSEWTNADLADCRRWIAQTSEIQPALEQMETAMASPSGNAELGRLCGMSEDHFIRRFGALMGVTPAEYGRRHRVALAAEWLTGTRRTIDEIAEASGFSDRSHFSRVFRQQLGVTPAAYRRMHKLEVV